MTASDDELRLETPDVDRLEQLTPLGDDPAEAPVGGIAGSLAEVIDADEADVLEQATPVSADEEYPTTAPERRRRVAQQGRYSVRARSGRAVAVPQLHFHAGGPRSARHVPAPAQRPQPRRRCPRDTVSVPAGGGEPRPAAGTGLQGLRPGGVGDPPSGRRPVMPIPPRAGRGIGHPDGRRGAAVLVVVTSRGGAGTAPVLRR